MQINHTTGQWYAKKGTHDWHVASQTGTGNDIALVREYKPEEAEANATLIAAAPEMYKALQAIVALVEGDYDNPALLEYGLLNVDSDIDILEIAKRALPYL